jgi:hypothetical protein
LFACTCQRPFDLKLIWFLLPQSSDWNISSVYLEVQRRTIAEGEPSGQARGNGKASGPPALCRNMHQPIDFNPFLSWLNLFPPVHLHCWEKV